MKQSPVDSSQENMRYLLRRVIFEDRWESQLAELIDLCRRVPIEEVLLMEQSHQMQMAPFPLEKHRRMAEIYRAMAERLRSEGIVFGVNIATLVGHSDTAVPPEGVLPYQKFVGSNLQPAHACYCILDEGWQDYAAAVCALYAAGKPDKLFVDDDFRSVNHSTAIGCFCPRHAAATGQALGLELSPRTLFDHVRGSNDQDRRVRQAWMAATFRGQLQAARKIREAVARVCATTRVGLMNSGEQQHSIQGRDMDALLRELAGPNHRPLSRPAGGSYGDAIHEDVFGVLQTMALSMHVLGADVQIVSEVENYPHTFFTKSLSCTARQMEWHALAGADDCSLNLYDYLATPFRQEPDIERLLRDNKARLGAIRQARRGKQLRGFGLPWKPDMAAHCFSRCGDVQDIVPDRTLDLLLPRFGIPTQFAPARGNALLGDAVQAFADAEIETFLRGGLMLDGRACEHLQRRGFGELLGCRVAGTLPRAAVERLDPHAFCGRFAGNNLPTGWYRLQSQGREISQLQLLEGAGALSTLLDLNMNEISPGTVLFENALGGRVAVLPVPAQTAAWFYRARAYVIGQIAQWLMFGNLPVRIEDCPDVGPFYYEDAATGAGLLGVVSGNPDPVTVKLQTNLNLRDLFTDEPAEPFVALSGGPQSRFYRTQR